MKKWINQNSATKHTAYIVHLTVILRIYGIFYAIHLSWKNWFMTEEKTHITYASRQLTNNKKCIAACSKASRQVKLIKNCTAACSKASRQVKLIKKCTAVCSKARRQVKLIKIALRLAQKQGGRLNSLRIVGICTKCAYSFAFLYIMHKPFGEKIRS